MCGEEKQTFHLATFKRTGGGGVKIRLSTRLNKLNASQTLLVYKLHSPAPLFNSISVIGSHNCQFDWGRGFYGAEFYEAAGQVLISLCC